MAEKIFKEEEVLKEEEILEGEYKAIAGAQIDEEEELLDKENVVGVAIGHKIKEGKETGDPCITVLVSQKLDSALLKADDRVPKTVGKFKTDVFETGEIFAGNLIPEPVEELAEVDTQVHAEVDIEALRGRLRPAKGGFSVGNFRITAGTIATAVTDLGPFPGIPRRYYILSNNHVLANSNNAFIGDPILQPGRFDGGLNPRDRIARLSRFVPIRFMRPPLIPVNFVDAAIAEGQFSDLDREIYWIGYVKGVRTVRIGQIVQKTGRTTNYTTGRVTTINATINVNYGGGRVARFARQIITTNMSRGGDSGSLLCDMNENACGLLFAGSSRVTVHNNIFFVIRFLRIRIV